MSNWTPPFHIFSTTQISPVYVEIRVGKFRSWHFASNNKRHNFLHRFFPSRYGSAPINCIWILIKQNHLYLVLLTTDVITIWVCFFTFATSTVFEIARFSFEWKFEMGLNHWQLVLSVKDHEICFEYNSFALILFCWNAFCTFIWFIFVLKMRKTYIF